MCSCSCSSSGLYWNKQGRWEVVASEGEELMEEGVGVEEGQEEEGAVAKSGAVAVLSGLPH
jgi:hypothetical protein